MNTRLWPFKTLNVDLCGRPLFTNTVTHMKLKTFHPSHQYNTSSALSNHHLPTSSLLLYVNVVFSIRVEGKELEEAQTTFH